MDETINMTVTASNGYEIPVNKIDAIGKVKESFTEETTCKKFFLLKIEWSVKRVSTGYHFKIHTSGGRNYWIRKDTEKQAEYERNSL